MMPPSYLKSWYLDGCLMKKKQELNVGHVLLALIISIEGIIAGDVGMSCARPVLIEKDQSSYWDCWIPCVYAIGAIMNCIKR